MVSQEDGRSVALTLSFSHPFERMGMDLALPVSFGVTHDGQDTDLLPELEPVIVMGSPGFTAGHALDRSGTRVLHI